MSVFSQLFNIGQGNLIKDPQRMCWWVGNEDDVNVGYINTPSGNSYASGYDMVTANFWTIAAYAGDVAQVAVHDVYVDVTSGGEVSGSGVLTNLFLPGFVEAGDTATVRVTVDSVEYTLSFVAVNITDRFVSGLIETISTYNAATSCSLWPDAASVDVATRLPDGGSGGFMFHTLISPSNTLACAPCIRFESTLHVEMKITLATPAGAMPSTNNRDDCAAIYLLD